MVTRYRCDEGDEHPTEDKDGDYVDYEDYEKLEEMLDIAWDAVEEAGYTGFSEKLKEYMERDNN